MCPIFHVEFVSLTLLYLKVDINLIMGSGNQIATPLVKDATSKGLKSISKEISVAEKILFESEDDEEVANFIKNESNCSLGTFSIYNLGEFIILVNQGFLFLS